LPLVPGVVRDLQGKLQINGSGENRNALLVNAMDVTDPATGQFGMTIPVDSVEAVNVYKSPFLAQYGRSLPASFRSKHDGAATNGTTNLTTHFLNFAISEGIYAACIPPRPALRLMGP
jgi:outer membrane receptor protein involved in Fe transport